MAQLFKVRKNTTRNTKILGTICCQTLCWMFQNFGFEESGEEINIGILDAKDRKFPMEPMDSFDSDDVRQFLKDYEKGT